MSAKQKDSLEHQVYSALISDIIRGCTHSILYLPKSSLLKNIM